MPAVVCGPYSPQPQTRIIEAWDIPICLNPNCGRHCAISHDGKRWLKYCDNPQCRKDVFYSKHLSAQSRKTTADILRQVTHQLTDVNQRLENVQDELADLKQSLEDLPKQLPLPIGDNSPSPRADNAGNAAPVGAQHVAPAGKVSTDDIAAKLEVTTAQTNTHWSNPILFNMLLSQYATDPRHWDHFSGECFRYGLSKNMFPPSLVKQAQAALAAKTPRSASPSPFTDNAGNAAPVGRMGGLGGEVNLTDLAAKPLDGADRLLTPPDLEDLDLL